MNNNMEVNVRRELLREILNQVPNMTLFEDLFVFYKEIFYQKPDLIVCMSRKAWSVIHLFLPLLEADGVIVDRKKLTHDQMVQPWFADSDRKNGPSQLKVFLVDDTFQTGRALDDCIRRLKWVYKVNEKNITVAVFAMTDSIRNRQRIENDHFFVYRSLSREKPFFRVNWSNFGKMCKKEEISKISSFFVEAIHACSEPYVGYTPAFWLPIKTVQDFLGNDRGKDSNSDSESNFYIPDYLEQNDLRPPLNDPAMIGYYNITNEKMRQHDIEAFYISLPILDSDNKNYLPFLPSNNMLSIVALRFYLNRKTGIALIVPYLSLEDCRVDADIVQMFPKKLQILMREMCSKEDWSEFEGYLSAYRLLQYAAGYLWGKYVFKQWLGLDVEEQHIASRGGICSDIFFAWLDSSSAEQDIANIWTALEKYVVAKEVRNFETDHWIGMEDIIKQGIHSSDVDQYLGVIRKSLSVNKINDYFGPVSMMFRNLLAKEHEILNNYINENADKDKESFVLPYSFQGFAIHTFFVLLLSQFPELKKRRDVLTTITIMLCDKGEAVTQLRQCEGVIGTVLYVGEQSCHALASIAPEYALFLSGFPSLLSKFGIAQRQIHFETAQGKIEAYFNDEKNQGIRRRLSVEGLMSLLEDIRDITINKPDQEFDHYSVLPRTSFFDCSEPFFLELVDKFKQYE